MPVQDDILGPLYRDRATGMAFMSEGVEYNLASIMHISVGWV